MSIRISFKALLLASLLASAVAAPVAYADDHATSEAHGHHFSPEQRAQWAKARLDHLANRLQITASQQSAWETFSAAWLNLQPQGDNKHPGADADAATLAKFHADRASEFAGKLATVADATAKLQAVLDDNQRKILTQVAHLVERHAHHDDHEKQGFRNNRHED